MKIIPIVCPSCGAQLEIAEERETCFCSYCGAQIMLVDENHTKHTYRKIDDARIREADVKEAIALKKIEVNEAKEKRENKTTLIILAICFGVPLILGLFFGLIIPACTNFANESAGMIQVGLSSDEFVYDNYKTVTAHLEAVGFTNIELVDLNDSGIAFWMDGSVKEVVIDGKSSFDREDWFKSSVKIVVIYH